jgi:hypothetical protein
MRDIYIISKFNLAARKPAYTGAIVNLPNSEIYIYDSNGYSHGSEVVKMGEAIQSCCISISGKVISSYGLCRFYDRHLVLLLISVLRISVDCTSVFPPTKT